MKALVHGTATGYKSHGCRCRACTDAANAYARRWRQVVRDGGGLIDTAEVQQHILALRAGGMSEYAIGRAAGGMSASLIRSIRRGQQKRIRPSTADRILSVPIGALVGVMQVGSKRARRLIDELGRCGINQRTIAAHLRYGPSTDLDIARSKHYVKRRSWDRLVVIYTHYARQGIVPASLLEEGS